MSLDLGKETYLEVQPIYEPRELFPLPSGIPQAVPAKALTGIRRASRGCVPSWLRLPRALLRDGVAGGGPGLRASGLEVRASLCLSLAEAPGSSCSPSCDWDRGGRGRGRLCYCED